MSSNNKHRSLLVKKKFQNKHSEGYVSRSKKRLSYDTDYWGYCTPPERNYQSRCKVWRGYSRKVKNRILRKYYNQWIDYEIIDYIDTNQIESNLSKKQNKLECTNCGYITIDDLQFCPICNLSFNEPSYLSERTHLRLYNNTATKLNKMKISNKAKHKINSYKLLQKHFVPILKQLNPVYFISFNQWRWWRWRYFNCSLLSKVNLSDSAKYKMLETEIICIVPEYMLQRLDIIFNDNKAFNPQIVYTMNEFMSKDKYKEKRINMKKIKNEMIENNNILKYYDKINSLLISGFVKYYFKRVPVPMDLHQLFLSFYGNDLLNIFNLWLPFNKESIVNCTKTIKSLPHWLAKHQEIFICLSLHQTVYSYCNGHWNYHYVIPIFNIKLCA